MKRNRLNDWVSLTIMVNDYSTIRINDKVYTHAKLVSIDYLYSTEVNWSVQADDKGYEIESGNLLLVDDKIINIHLRSSSPVFNITTNTPADITINGKEYKDTNDVSVRVSNGDSVSWKVSKRGYVSQEATEIARDDVWRYVDLKTEDYVPNIVCLWAAVTNNEFDLK